jgi:hypothetical protein
VQILHHSFFLTFLASKLVNLHQPFDFPIFKSKGP